MKSLTVLLGIAAAAFLAAPVLAEPPEKTSGRQVAAAEPRLVGRWQGHIPCNGDLHFRANGTYERTGYGPGAVDSAGAWTVRRDTVPPTLVMTCKRSQIEEEAGRVTEVRILRLDDTDLVIGDPPDKGDRPGRNAYTRVRSGKD